MKIHAFNKIWWTLFFINIVIMVALRYYLTGVLTATRNTIIFDLSLAVCVYFICYRLHILNKFERWSNDFYNYLPLYPCNILTFVLPITIMFHSSFFEATTMLFGTTFPLLAICMPTDDVKDLPLFSAEGSGFYFAHYGMWVLSIVYTSFVKPNDMLWILRAMVIFVSIMFIEHMINLYLRKTHKYDRANFGFTCDRENNPFFEKLYSYVPYDFFYILPLLPVFGLIGVVIHLLLTL